MNHYLIAFVDDEDASTEDIISVQGLSLKEVLGKNNIAVEKVLRVNVNGINVFDKVNYPDIPLPEGK